jgi:hypothetical protein
VRQLDGLARILEAGAPEELFHGPEPEALFLYDLLNDVTAASARPTTGRSVVPPGCAAYRPNTSSIARPSW